jgi:hypothetical protein
VPPDSIERVVIGHVFANIYSEDRLSALLLEVAANADDRCRTRIMNGRQQLHHVTPSDDPELVARNDCRGRAQNVDPSPHGVTGARLSGVHGDRAVLVFDANAGH